MAKLLQVKHNHKRFDRMAHPEVKGPREGYSGVRFVQNRMSYILMVGDKRIPRAKKNLSLMDFITLLY